MTTIRVVCAVCGDCEVSPADVKVGAASYSFTHCRVLQVRRASPRVETVLVASGSERLTLQLPHRSWVRRLAEWWTLFRFRGQLQVVDSVGDLWR